MSDDTKPTPTHYCVSGCGAILPLEAHDPRCPAVGGEGFDPMPPDLPERILEGAAMGRAIADAEDRRSYREAVANGWPITSKAGVSAPSPEALADAAQRAEAFAERAEPRVWAWLNRHDSPWSPSDATVRELAYDLGTLAAPIVEPPRHPKPAWDAALLAEAGAFDVHGEARHAIDRIVAKIVEEDARARSLLPDAPAGWEWEASLQPEAVGREVLGEVVVKIVYRLREATL